MTASASAVEQEQGLSSSKQDTFQSLAMSFLKMSKRAIQPKGFGFETLPG
jgi:hypothetical protein